MMPNRFTVQSDKAIRIEVKRSFSHRKAFLYDKSIESLYRVCTYIREKYHNNKHTINGRM